MRGKLLLASLLILPLLAIAASTAFGVNFIIGCTESHRNNDDMILFPQQPGLSHNHTYFGARENNAFSTVESLRASGTTCGNAGDTSGAWIPSWYPIHPQKGALLYYTGDSSTNIEPFINGLKMIVRWEHPNNRVRFKCGPGSATETRTPPASCSSGMLVAVVDFPRWWNGRDLDSPDHISHMSYSKTATHNVRTIFVKAYVRMGVPPSQPINPNNSAGSYQQFHMDYIGAWKRAELEALKVKCFNTGQNCGQNPS